MGDEINHIIQLCDLLGQKVLFGTHYLRPSEACINCPPCAKLASSCDWHPLKHCITWRSVLTEGNRNKDEKEEDSYKLFKIFDDRF